MASSWITRRETSNGATRYRVEFRVGGRESRTRYGGSFKTKREADERKRWVSGELAAQRVPNIGALTVEQPWVATVADAVVRWRESRVDVTEATRVRHRVALNRVLPVLGPVPVDAVTADDVARLVETLSDAR